MEDIKKERLSYARVNEMLRARMRREATILGIGFAIEVLLIVCLLLCCSYLEWHPLAVAQTAVAAALFIVVLGFWLRCYLKARALVKNVRYRIVTDTLSHVAHNCRARFGDVNYKMLINGRSFGAKCLTEVWFDTYGCVRVSPSALRYPFAGEPYYLVVTDEAPNEILHFFDAKYYELKEDAPSLR